MLLLPGKLLLPAPGAVGAQIRRGAEHAVIEQSQQSAACHRCRDRHDKRKLYRIGSPDSLAQKPRTQHAGQRHHRTGGKIRSPG